MNRPFAMYRMRSTLPSTGLMSCVTSSTAAPVLAAVPVDEADDRLLVGEVEARERLVAQQQRRIVGERLADAQALLLAAREHADGPVGERARRRPHR